MALSATALISLAEAKTHLNVGDTSQDTLLEALIESCTSRILQALQNHVVIQSRTEHHAGGRKRIYLQRYPVVSGPTIIDEAGITVPDTYYLLEAERGILQHAGLHWPVAQAADGKISRWIITYASGLAVDTASVPADIKLACKLLVAETFSRREPDLTAKRIGDLSLQYRPKQADDAGMPLHVANLLSPYMSQGV